MSTYSGISLCWPSKPLVEYETTDYSSPEGGVVKRHAYQKTHLQSFQNFRSLDELIGKYGAPAVNPNFDSSKPAGFNNQRTSGYFLDAADVRAVVRDMEPLFKILAALPDKAIEALDNGEMGALAAILGSNAKAKKLEKEIDAASYDTPFYLASDSFLYSKFLRAAKIFMGLEVATREIPLVGEEMFKCPPESAAAVFYDCN